MILSFEQIILLYNCMSKILGHTGFQPLKEVWLGDSYPSHFYSQIKNSKLRDLCLMIDEITKEDLYKIQKTIEFFGVTVCRPNFESIDQYIDEHDNLLKPPITPRDWALVLNDTLYINPQYPSGVEPFQTDIDRYQQHNQNVKVLKRFQDTPEDWCWITYPSFVRVGHDIYIDYDPNNLTHTQSVNNIATELSKKYRVHLGNTGDHSDGVFCPVSPGNIMATHYRKHYSLGWPNWNVIALPDSTRSKTNSFNGRWWGPGVDLCHFNDKMIHSIQSWLGNSSETVFEVNALVIDEQNILVLAYDEYVCRALKNIGLTPHVVDFRTRGFWDGGLHCLTLDIHRTGECLDYWPDRGPNGIDNNH
jgi:hypothetical protein